ncbi:MAG: hemerythrin domain-containing protein [Archangium sp.]|nr:hemerythrin domain-containing protein [Archangium sp.]
MDALVETLRAQHRELEALCKTLTTALHHDDLPPVQRALQAFGASLLTHLALEDDSLYPAMLNGVDRRSIRSAAGAAGAVDARTLRTFTDNMKRVSEALKAFLAQPVETVPQLHALRKEWPEVQHLLDSRIQSEERVLYPMYEERIGARLK